MGKKWKTHSQFTENPFKFTFMKIIQSVLLGLFLLWIPVWNQLPDTIKAPNYTRTHQKEKPGRGFIAIGLENGHAALSWRFLEKDDPDITFDLYRQTGKGKSVKLNHYPITNATWYRDSTDNTHQNNTYVLKKSGDTATLAQYQLTPQLAQKPYLSIHMQPVSGDQEWLYAPNDASAGDLDGDGDYELVIKRENGGFDNSHRGLCHGTTLLEAYELNGTFLWRVDLGPNIRQGAHYTWFMVFDMDGDGMAEVAVRTSEGTRFGDGNLIGDTDQDGKTDYVDRNPESKTYGMILEGPEFLSVIEGRSGREMARAPYISRGAPGGFGDTEGNRSDRFLGGMGYFDGQQPSILICRGYYAKTVLEAWDYRQGILSRKWVFSTTDNNGKYKDYEGQGNHNLSIGDVDGDGRDEIIYGACMIDHDGSGGYNTRLGHGDAIHLTDIDIDRPGLEVWTCHEGAPNRAGSEMRDARTGDLLWGIPAVEDVGRALAADIDPRFRGCEAWTISSGGVYTADGKLITERTPSINMAIWWDGDLNRELLDGSGVPRRGHLAVTKWNGDGIDTLKLTDQQDLTANNHTKGTPCLHADILGDWREEIVARTHDNREVRIYLTPFETHYRFHTLMSDPVYRMSVANQNVGYNQPTQPGFYLGSDLGLFWKRSYLGIHSKKGVAPDGRPNGMNARLKNARLVEERCIFCNDNTYQFDAGYYYDSYRWVVDGKEAGTARTLLLKASDFRPNQEIQVTITAFIKGCKFSDTASIRFVTDQSGF